MPPPDLTLGRLPDSFRRHRFATLLFLLMVTLAVAPIFAAVTGIDLWEFLFGLILLAAIASAADVPWIRTLVLLGLGFFAVRLVQILVGAAALTPLSQVLWISTALLATVVTMRHALRAGQVDSERICAALDAYLLLGLIFGVGYRLIAETWPGSFTMAVEVPLSLGRAVYFSFVTLATLGYGDIVPASDAAAGVTIVEAMIGQFYLVVLVARLVSLYAKADGDGPG
jgi:voltage-gated potassium channel Kch